MGALPLVFVTSRAEKAREAERLGSRSSVSTGPPRAAGARSLRDRRAEGPDGVRSCSNVRSSSRTAGSRSAAWGGFPGALVKWLEKSAGVGGAREDARRVSRTAPRPRSARSPTATAARSSTARRGDRGSIAAAPRGGSGFGWDVIFVPGGQRPHVRRDGAGGEGPRLAPPEGLGRACGPAAGRAAMRRASARRVCSPLASRRRPARAAALLAPRRPRPAIRRGPAAILAVSRRSSSGLEVPWSMAFTSPSRLLVTERPGRVRVVSGRPARRRSRSRRSRTSRRKGESGLMGIALAPDYASSRELFLCYAYDTPVRAARCGSRGSATTAIASRAGRVLHRGDSGRAVPRRLPPALRAGRQALRHDGGRDRRARSRRTSRSLGGKTLRLNPDGTIPADNPFPGSPVFSLRPPQLAGPRLGPALGPASSRPSTARPASTARAAATRSTSSRPARTTAGRSSITASLAPAWCRRSSSTRRRSRPRAPRSAAARCCRPSAGTSSSRRCAASG